MVALLIQCCVGFCRRAKWISYMFTRSPRSLFLRHLRRWYRSARCSQLPCSVPGLVQPPLSCAVALEGGCGVCVVIASGCLVGRTASRLSPSWKKSLPQWHRKMNSRTLLLRSPLAAAAALGFTLTTLCQVSRRLIPQRRESWPRAISSALSSCQHCWHSLTPPAFMLLTELTPPRSESGVTQNAPSLLLSEAQAPTSATCSCHMWQLPWENRILIPCSIQGGIWWTVFSFHWNSIIIFQ